MVGPRFWAICMTSAPSVVLALCPALQYLVCCNKLRRLSSGALTLTV
jgi:hypothetical protein